MKASWILAVAVMILTVVATGCGRGGSSADDEGSNPSLPQSVFMTTLDEDSQWRDLSDRGVVSVEVAPAAGVSPPARPGFESRIAPPPGVTRAPFVAPAASTVSTPPQSPETAPGPADGPYRLDRESFYLLAITVGFERGHVIEEAYRVACGGGSTRFGESACTPSITNGHHIGLFQLDPGWAEFCGTDPWTLYYPAVNLHCTRQILLYEESRGLPRWSHWQVQPQ